MVSGVGGASSGNQPNNINISDAEVDEYAKKKLGMRKPKSKDQITLYRDFVRGAYSSEILARRDQPDLLGLEDYVSPGVIYGVAGGTAGYFAGGPLGGVIGEGVGSIAGSENSKELESSIFGLAGGTAGFFAGGLGGAIAGGIAAEYAGPPVKNFFEKLIDNIFGE